MKLLFCLYSAILHTITPHRPNKFRLAAWFTMHGTIPQFLSTDYHLCVSSSISYFMRHSFILMHYCLTGTCLRSSNRGNIRSVALYPMKTIFLIHRKELFHYYSAVIQHTSCLLIFSQEKTSTGSCKVGLWNMSKCTTTYYLGNNLTACFSVSAINE